ncbi:MAG: GTPase Era [Gammaproteobacteria bacterium]
MRRAGYVTLLGRPNVGKSTLLNHLLEQKISITSPKPQTTRHIILGIKTVSATLSEEPDTQIVYVDTPGLHRPGKRALNRYMNRVATDSLGFADIAVFLVEALRWTEEDDIVLQSLKDFEKPVLVAVNKIDRVQDKTRLLPFLKELTGRRAFTEIIPLSALRADNIELLERAIISRLPQAEFFFSEDEITTASQRFLAAEIIREKLFRRLNKEVPYALTVEIEQFQERAGQGKARVLHIGAVIWVERAGQKGIVIGDKGATLKEIGQQARLDMERLFESRVFLETWVKVRQGWSDDERALQQLGYQDDVS